MRIRPARKQDREAMARLHKASIQALCADRYDAGQRAAWTACIRPEAYDQALRDKVFLVSEEQGELLGLGMLDADRAEINALYVAPEAVGRGVGGALLEALERAMAERETGRSLTVRATLNSQGFYARNGYRERGRDEYPLPHGVRLACVIMVKAPG